MANSETIFDQLITKFKSLAAAGKAHGIQDRQRVYEIRNLSEPVKKVIRFLLWSKDQLRLSDRAFVEELRKLIK